MIVKLDKCRVCGILREHSLHGECAVCGGNDFEEVMFCDRHHAEAPGGVCEYCENERRFAAQPKPKPTRTATQVPPQTQRPPVIPKPQPAPKPPVFKPPQAPSPAPQPAPVPTAPPVVKTERSRMGCMGCLLWVIGIIALIIALNYFF